jgi:polyphosphate glucokinase
VTLAIDIGGTGLKASVLDASGRMLVERQRILTAYPMPPEKLVSALVGLASKLPPFDRVSAGFPGVVRAGRVLTAPHFVTRAGPGTEVVPELAQAWTGFDLAEALSAALGKPAKVVNDADLQGAAVVDANGLELVVTLGTGVGTGLFYEGRLCPHLELAHHPLGKGQTYNQRLGEAARKRVGNKKWNMRVREAIDILYALFIYDRLFIGGGNATRITFDLPANATIIDNAAGILGGIKLWERDTP